MAQAIMDQHSPRTVLPRAPRAAGTAFGCSRDFLGQRFVYVVVSPRARGLSVGVNLSPDRQCNFDCVYCEVDRSQPPPCATLDLEAMAGELKRTLDLVRMGLLRERPPFAGLPPELLTLRHVTLSGDGEPTQCPVFLEAVESVVHLRALGGEPCFKVVLVTNASGFDRAEVQAGLKFLTRSDEIWAKLDAGTQAYMDRVNRTEVPLVRILENILMVARQRPVVIQSLFPRINGVVPETAEIDAYSARLKELVAAGGRIELVQIYSANRPTPHAECDHLPLPVLSQIAKRVREATGLRVEVY